MILVTSLKLLEMGFPANSFTKIYLWNGLRKFDPKQIDSEIAKCNPFRRVYGSFKLWSLKRNFKQFPRTETWLKFWHLNRLLNRLYLHLKRLIILDWEKASTQWNPLSLSSWNRLSGSLKVLRWDSFILGRMRQPDRQDTFLFDKSFGGWWNLSQSWPMSSPMIMHDPIII